MDYRTEPGGHLQGHVRVPGDKSISHRAIMLSAVASGTSRIRGLLEGHDVLATRDALRRMGVPIERCGPGHYVVHGVGRCGLRAPGQPLDLGNSGTAMRLFAGLLAGQGFASELTGDASLHRRPMVRVAQPLKDMGAEISVSAAGTPPLRIGAVPALRAIDYELPVPSAQVKSAILLAGMYAEGTTCVREPVVTRDHTERMLVAMGCPCEIGNGRVCVPGCAPLTGIDMTIPGDLSSAAFFIVGACIASGSVITLEGIGVNPTRIGVISLLRRMGADIRLSGARELGGEPVADIEVRHSPLKGIDVADADIPLAIDEIPILCVAAACAEGVTRISGAGELRHKESDRIAVMAGGLRALGARVAETADGLVITGGRFSGGVVDSGTDHRVAMAMTIAGLCAAGPVTVRECENVATSFPDFPRVARSLGLPLSDGS